ncbi:MAG: sodium:proton antiporter NhaD [Gammaproteobacteria bacterium]|nr:sodium:proton antiporter NhaD [Gammaproteobacteria bacterium]MCY4281817.1 sodium:proton antiporter NhaD [Gammaproteobacteria bacterium]MCY4338743.1 sodium:proton antiporter NhaD [Gammaproteobacteria bacterium]
MRTSTFYMTRILPGLLLLLVPVMGIAAVSGVAPEALDFTGHWAAIAALVIFVIAYALVISEETLHLRKSKPTIVAAGIIWVLVAFTYGQFDQAHALEGKLSHSLLEFVELFLFLLAAMTYINTMDERGVFAMLRAWLLAQQFNLRQLFWITGAISFVLSPIIDNLTTALLMATVICAVGGDNKRFIAIGCVNIVVAANAGGAFSPFGDITTLMVWQQGIVQFQEFLVLFLPSLAGWLVTAGIMSFALSTERPEAVMEEATLKYGAWIVVALFLLTITMAVSFHNFLHLPPVLGMMTGLGLLNLFGYYLKRRDAALFNTNQAMQAQGDEFSALDGWQNNRKHYDIYQNLQRAEWDTLMFFYGIILCVAGLGAFGYMAIVSEFFYVELGPTYANIFVGFASAIVDNIPVMFAVLEMRPDMDHGQWLLVTLTAGIGGSMLSIGSAAGVAVMGQARGIYTFFSHFKWSWAILLGYIVSIAVHFTVNASLFTS